MRKDITKRDSCDSVIKIPNAGCILCHVQVIFAFQAFEQVRMPLEDFA